jgi:hypothetical protein
MYRGDESVDSWPDRNEMLGECKEAFAGDVANPEHMHQPAIANTASDIAN